MARLITASRELSVPPSSGSDSSDSCIVLAPSLTSASRQSSNSTPPTSVASVASQDEPPAKQPVPSKKRPSSSRPTNISRLESFGFTSTARPVKTQSSPALLVPKAKVARRTSSRRNASWLEEGSDEEDQSRQVSAASYTPLLGENSVRTGESGVRKVAHGDPGVQEDRSHQPLKTHILEGFLPPLDPDSNRQFSGATLVDEDAVAEADIKQSTEDRRLEKKPAMMKQEARKQADVDEMVEATEDVKQVKRQSRMGKMMGAVSATASSLGKRGRDAFEKSKEKLHVGDRRKSSRILAAEVEEHVPVEAPSSKKIKRSAASAPNLLSGKTTAIFSSPTKKASKPKKSWLNHGMYLGQDRNFQPTLSGVRNKKRDSTIGTAVPQENKSLPLPMFTGEDMLNVGRDFKLPFDVHAPLPPGQPKPDEWKKTQSNRTIGDAAQAVAEWRKFTKLPASKCYCSLPSGCDEDCLNRSMFYECDDTNCAIGADQCTNRGFAELKERCKRGNKYDIGVEVVKTDGKGFGVRSCRTFNAGQIIVEYAGEMINREECERRMREEYNDNTCYYLMTFDRNLIIDATRGTIARFVNHSCAPNCHMIKWTVAGKPRMALFAGDRGIMTGEELTYDYNFDNFDKNKLTLCRCGAAACRGVLGPKPTEQELKKARLAAATAEMAERARSVMEALVKGRDGNGKKRKKHKGWAYLDADGNEVSEPDSDVEAEQRASKKPKTAANDQGDAELDDEKKPTKTSKRATIVAGAATVIRSGKGRGTTVAMATNTTAAFQHEGTATDDGKLSRRKSLFRKAL